MTPTDVNIVRLAPLGDVARIQPGYLSRTRVRTVATGTHALLQGRDVSTGGNLHLDAAVRFKPERDADLYQVSQGDILLAARGHDHHACLIDVHLDNVLASSVFYIIRALQNAVLPAYLTWSLNQPKAQAALAVASSGTGIVYITRSSIECLPIAIPPLRVQHQIVDAITLLRHSHFLQAQLETKREQLTHALCRKATGTIKD